MKNSKFAIIARIAKRLSLYVDHFRALYGPVFPLRPLSTIALCSLYGPLSPLQSSVPLRPTVVSMALCLLFSPYPLCDPLSPLRPSVLSWPLCPLYSRLSPS